MKDIVEKGKLNDATRAQREEFLSLFYQEDKEYELKKFLFDELSAYEVEEADASFKNISFDKIWTKITGATQFVPRKKKLLIRFAQLAAILVVGLLLGYYLKSVDKQSLVYYTSIAPKGSISGTYLPDGTLIYLNSGSEIRYTMEGHSGMREVYLKGEAWFQVEKNKKKPFLVHTPVYDVQVTGTSFNVKAYVEDKDVITTLEEGSVCVKSSDNVKLSEELNLKPGEQLVYNKESNKINVQEVNTKWYTSWKDNKLVFINMSLAELKVLLERKFGVEIEIADSDILNCHYDGTIKDETVLEVLDILSHTLPVEYHIEGQKIVIHKKI